MNHQNKRDNLAEVSAGAIVKVASLEGGKGFVAHLNDMGIRNGVTMQVVSNSAGPVLVKIGESRFAIGHEMARKIWIEKILQRD